MMDMLVTFAALSMAGTVILSLLPEGGLKRTAGMAVGLLSLLCWAEGVSAFFGVDISIDLPETALAPTTVSIEASEEAAASAMVTQWEAAP